MTSAPDLTWPQAIEVAASSVAHLAIRTASVDEGDLPLPYEKIRRRPEVAQRWIAEYAEITADFNGVCPPGVASAFVLQYTLDPLATVTATLAERTTWVPDLRLDRWSMALEPTGLYPVAVQVRRGAARQIHDPQIRYSLARDVYRSAASSLARHHPAQEKMSSRQRFGMVGDMWAGAIARLRGEMPPRRLSCCLIYALPGMVPCAGCPRT